MQTGSTCPYTVILAIQFIYFLDQSKTLEGGNIFCDVLIKVARIKKIRGGGGRSKRIQ
jgi:hypothetical protein